MKEAISKAIEGGYKLGEMSQKDLANYWFAHEGTIQLDPLFWSALGKALELEGSTYRWQKEGEEKWITLWHRFVNHLIAGKDPEEFFSSLLDNKQ